MMALHVKDLGGTNIQNLNLYPPEKAEAIDRINTWVYTDLANGAYKSGFSSNQDVYEAAHDRYFAALDRVEGILARSPFLVGDLPTEADVRLFPVMFR